MIVAVVCAVLVSALACPRTTILGFGAAATEAALVDATTVRLNYYKNLCDPKRSFEGHSLALFANLDASSKSSCNDSCDYALFSNDHYNCAERDRVVGRGAQIKPLVSSSSSSGRSSMNVSLADGLAIRVEGDSDNVKKNYTVNAPRVARPTKSIDEKGLLRLLAAKVLNLQQRPILTNVGEYSISPRCRRETARYLAALKDFQLWAVEMFDATAKLPSGVLNGNVNQFGDFDQCLRVQEPKQSHHRRISGSSNQNGDIRGKYCLAYLQPTLPEDNSYESLKYFHDHVQSWNAFRSNFDDPGHRVPRFSTINWALCVPSGCSHTDVEIILRETLANFTQGLRFKMQVRVEEEMCQVYESPFDKIDKSTIYAFAFFGFFLFITLAMTLYDHYIPDSSEKSEWLTTFSLKRNVSSLISLKREGNDIPSVHGIRFINAVMLVVAHKSMALFFQPYANRTEMAETLGRSWTVIGRAASLYTDPFIMLSGLLTTYSLYGRLQRGQIIKVFQEYSSRLLRIVPTLGALILFCTFVLPLIGSGPQWNLVVSHHANICKSYWWRNLLFIHNYFGFENMCLTHTHHIGIDTQLFLLAPFITIALFRWPRRALQIILGLALMSTVARYYVTVQKDLSNYVFFGTSVAQLFDTANFMYILPAHRLTVYLMGVCLAFVLRHTKGMQLTKKQLQMGWYVNIVLLIAAFFGPAPMGSRDYVYNSTHAAHYAAFGPIAYCSFFAWVIFTSHLGHHTWLSRQFSWKGFMITTRLSYAVYLTQFPVFFYNVGMTRTSDYYEFIRMTININEIIWIVLTSVILTLMFDTPFGNIKKLLFKSPTKANSATNNNSIETKNHNTEMKSISSEIGHTKWE